MSPSWPESRCRSGSPPTVETLPQHSPGRRRLWASAHSHSGLAPRGPPSLVTIPPRIRRSDGRRLPRKVLNTIGPREMTANLVKERKLQVLFLNSYLYNEQHSCL